MPHRLEYLSDDKILNLQEAALLLGLEHLTIGYLAKRKAYDLKS
jgi:hypothetical protein